MAKEASTQPPKGLQVFLSRHRQYSLSRVEAVGCNHQTLAVGAELLVASEVIVLGNL